MFRQVFNLQVAKQIGGRTMTLARRNMTADTKFFKPKSNDPSQWCDLFDRNLSQWSKPRLVTYKHTPKPMSLYKRHYLIDDPPQYVRNPKIILDTMKAKPNSPSTSATVHAARLALQARKMGLKAEIVKPKIAVGIDMASTVKKFRPKTKIKSKLISPQPTWAKMTKRDGADKKIDQTKSPNWVESGMEKFIRQWRKEQPITKNAGRSAY